MAIRVISEEPVKWLEVVCPNCYYKLQYTPNDVTNDYDGDPMLLCPRKECNFAFYVKRC